MKFFRWLQTLWWAKGIEPISEEQLANVIKYQESSLEMLKNLYLHTQSADLKFKDCEEENEIYKTTS